MVRHTRPERSGRGSFPTLGLAGAADLIADPAEPARIARSARAPSSASQRRPGATGVTAIATNDRPWSTPAKTGLYFASRWQTLVT
jgi:hypothetical protein